MMTKHSDQQLALRACLVLAGCTQAIVVAGFFAHLAIYQWLPDPDAPVARVLRRIELTHEPSLNQWFSSSLFLVCTMLFGAIGWYRRRILDPDSRVWYGLAGLALLASIDEAVMLHEMLDRPFREALNLGGALRIAWIIPGTIIASILAISLLGFLRRLPSSLRKRFLVAAGVFFAGAILMEMPGGIYFERYGFTTPHYIATYAIEEWLEQMALCLLIHTLLRQLLPMIREVKKSHVESGFLRGQEGRFSDTVEGVHHE